MTKALVISDTHGSLELVEEAGRKAIEDFGTRLVLHLGDDLENAEPLRRLGLEVRGVQGVYHPDYLKPEPPNRLLVRLGKAALLLTHSRLPHPHDRPEGGDPAEVARSLGAAAVLHGHTHVPGIERDADGLLWINPGHLKASDKRGWPPSLAVIQAEAGRLTVIIEELHSGKRLFRWPEPADE